MLDTDSYCPHSVSDAQILSLKGVAEVFWYCVEGLHTVRPVQRRSCVLFGGADW